MTDETCCGACGYPVHATKEMACDWCRQAADRIEALTSKLAKAVEALEKAATDMDDYVGRGYGDSFRDTLAEVKAT